MEEIITKTNKETTKDWNANESLQNKISTLERNNVPFCKSQKISENTTA